MDNNWQEWKERIVGYTRKIKQADRGQKRTRLAILFLCGLLLLVVAVPVPKTGEVDKDTKIDGESRKGETYETDAMADYEKYLDDYEKGVFPFLQGQETRPRARAPGHSHLCYLFLFRTGRVRQNRKDGRKLRLSDPHRQYARFL